MKFYIVYLKRYIQSFTKRLAFLVLGIAIATTFVSYFGILTDCNQATKNEARYINNGEFHAYAHNVTPDILDEVKERKDLSCVANSYTIGTIRINNQRLFIGSMEEEAINLSRLSLITGKLPENDDEIAMDEVYIKNLNSKISIGDDVYLDITVTRNGEEELIEKSYRLVGVYRNKALSTLLLNSVSLDGSIKEYAIMPIVLISSSELSNINKDYDIQTNTLIKCKEEKNISNIIQSLSARVFNINPAYTNLMTAVQQQDDETFATDNKILVFIVIILSILGILNSFYITIQEREYQLGVIRAIGANKRHICSIVLGEAMFVSVIGIPIGLHSSISLIKLTLNILEKVAAQQQIMLIVPETIIKAALLSFITIIISALIPAIRASKVSPIKVISGQSYITNLSKKEKHKTIINNPTFIMVIRNLTRQWRRTLMTAIVLVLMAFTIMFSFNYNKLFLKSMNAKKSDMKSSYSVNITTSTTQGLGVILSEYGMSDMQIEKLKQVNGIRKVSAYKKLFGALCGLPLNSITEYYRKVPGLIIPDNMVDQLGSWQQKQISMLEDDLQAADISIVGVSDDILLELNKEINIDDLNSGILYVPIKGTGFKAVDFNELGLEPGCEISLVYNNNSGNDDFDITNIRLTKVINQLPISMTSEDIFVDKVCILINEKSFIKLTNESLFNDIYIYVDNSIIKNSIQFNEEIREFVQLSDLKIKSKLEMLEYDTNNGELVLARLYITSIVIMLLAAFIFINSIITSILSRKREFGMLRAIGMSKQQLNKMVFIENGITCIGAVIISIGLLLLIIVATGSIDLDGNKLAVSSQFPWSFSLILMITMTLISIVVSRVMLQKVLQTGIIDSIRYVE